MERGAERGIEERGVGVEERKRGKNKPCTGGREVVLEAESTILGTSRTLREGSMREDPTRERESERVHLGGALRLGGSKGNEERNVE